MKNDFVHSLPELLSKIEIKNKPSGFSIVFQGEKVNVMFNDNLPLKILSSMSIDEDQHVIICQNDVILPVKKVVI